MQSMFDTVETENQLSFAEKLHFRVLNSEYSIENRAMWTMVILVQISKDQVSRI